jgi:hypothetical protein
MKKTISIALTILILIFLIPNPAISQTTKKTASPTPTENPFEKQINSITSKIASRVAQLKLVEKRGIIGTVESSSNTQLTVTDASGNTKFIDVDEFTKFSSSTSKSFGISDIEKGDKLGILGLYNKESRRTLARFIDVLDLPQVIHGAVTGIDAKNFVLTLASEDGKEYSIDVASSTRTVTYDDEEKELIKSGFSKIEEGQRIAAIGYFDTKDAKLLEASRVIVLPNLSVNPKIKPQASVSPQESSNE